MHSTISSVDQLQNQIALFDLEETGQTVKASKMKVAKADISAGKNSYVYDAHTYHTKVPPEGIMQIIVSRTNPGDLILDPFCGSGMTGVAAAELGRRAILSDISPAATFIAQNLCTPISAHSYMDAVTRVLETARPLEMTLFGTHCRKCGAEVPLLYTVWSYGALCNHCGREFVIWDAARDERPSVKESKILTRFPCPHCGRMVTKRQLMRTRRYPVQVGYKCSCTRSLREQQAPLDEDDLRRLRAIEAKGVPSELWYPTDRFPDGVNTRQAIAAGIERVDQAYTTRSLWAMAYLWNLARDWPDRLVRPKLLFTLTSLYQRVTLFSEFRFWGGSGNTANYSVPAIANEQNVFAVFARKGKTIAQYFSHAKKGVWNVTVMTKSACNLDHIADGSVDYVFTDPPFGANINYSEMNFLWESWLRSFTDTREEAIVNRFQGKGYHEYEDLLTTAFGEIRRVLKPGKWLTLVFHNSSARAWQALQNSISNSGFAIEEVQTFDKRHGTFKQHVSENAVGYDLILHCRARQDAGSVEDIDNAESAVTDFVHRALVSDKDLYVKRYLHVTRGDEVDYRLLYSKWLAQELVKSRVELSFERFRRLASTVVSSLRRGNDDLDGDGH